MKSTARVWQQFLSSWTSISTSVPPQYMWNSCSKFSLKHSLYLSEVPHHFASIYTTSIKSGSLWVSSRHSNTFTFLQHANQPLLNCYLIHHYIHPCNFFNFFFAIRIALHVENKHCRLHNIRVKFFSLVAIVSKGYAKWSSLVARTTFFLKVITTVTGRKQDGHNTHSMKSRSIHMTTKSHMTTHGYGGQ